MPDAGAARPTDGGWSGRTSCSQDRRCRGRLGHASRSRPSAGSGSRIQRPCRRRRVPESSANRGPAAPVRKRRAHDARRRRRPAVRLPARLRRHRPAHRPSRTSMWICPLPKRPAATRVRPDESRNRHVAVRNPCARRGAIPNRGRSRPRVQRRSHCR